MANVKDLFSLELELNLGKSKNKIMEKLEEQQKQQQREEVLFKELEELEEEESDNVGLVKSTQKKGQLKKLKKFEGSPLPSNVQTIVDPQSLSAQIQNKVQNVYTIQQGNKNIIKDSSFKRLIKNKNFTGYLHDIILNFTESSSISNNLEKFKQIFNVDINETKVTVGINRGKTYLTYIITDKQTNVTFYAKVLKEEIKENYIQFSKVYNNKRSSNLIAKKLFESTIGVGESTTKKFGEFTFTQTKTKK